MKKRRARHTGLPLVVCLILASGAVSCGDDTQETPAAADTAKADVAADAAVDVGGNQQTKDTNGTADSAQDVADTTMPDTAADVANDVATDVVPDTSLDVAADVAEDVVADVTPDITGEVLPDAAEDVLADVTQDSLPDPSQDTMEDIAADALADVAFDVEEDGGTDAGPDAVADADATTPPPVAGCVTCHTDKEILLAMASAPPEEPETDGG